LVLLGSGLPPPSSGLASFTSVRLVVFSLCMEMGRLRRLS
jgi:Trk-type K+ transport system membrane component